MICLCTCDDEFNSHLPLRPSLQWFPSCARGTENRKRCTIEAISHAIYILLLSWISDIPIFLLAICREFEKIFLCLYFTFLNDKLFSINLFIHMHFLDLYFFPTIFSYRWVFWAKIFLDKLHCNFLLINLSQDVS